MNHLFCYAKKYFNEISFCIPVPKALQIFNPFCANIGSSVKSYIFPFTSFGLWSMYILNDSSIPDMIDFKILFNFLGNSNVGLVQN